jgi:phosphoglycolate phosphatase
MNFDAILFDLDGTLLDTLADVAWAANRVLADCGYPTHPVDAYRNYIGSGVRRLYERILPDGRRDEAAVARCVEAFQQAYAGHWNVQTRPYDGVPELLDGLTARGLRMAVLSNKPEAFSRRCVDEYLSGWRFEVVLGQREGIPPKPDPAGAREVVERLGVAAERFLYVGDTATDMQTALAAGMYPVGVAWGFRPVEELRAAGAARIVDRPADLVELLDRRPPASRGTGG